MAQPWRLGARVAARAVAGGGRQPRLPPNPPPAGNVGGLGRRIGRYGWLAGTPGRGGAVRWLSAGEGDKKNPAMVDVEGGKINEPAPDEGKLYVSERAKNIFAAHHRFQLSTYNRLPDGRDDMTAIHSDPSEPITGLMDPETCNVILQLHPENRSHAHHLENITRLASSALVAGHIDPPPLIPIFSRVGLMPPVVRLLGDISEVPEAEEADLRQQLKTAGRDTGGKLYWFEVGGGIYQDTFDKQTPLSMRDFRAAYVDQLASSQMQLIYLANTKYLDDLTNFCKAFLGVAVEEAYLYTADRAGFSVFALREGTENQWREYRFPFAREVVSLEDFESMLTTMVAEEKLGREEEAKKQKGDHASGTEAGNAGGGGSHNVRPGTME